MSHLFSRLFKFPVEGKHNWAETMDLSSVHLIQNPILSSYSLSNIYKAPAYGCLGGDL